MNSKLKNQFVKNALVQIGLLFLAFPILLFLQTAFIVHAETLSLDKPLVIRWKSDTRNIYVFSNNEKVLSIDENGNMVLISQIDGKIIWKLNQGMDISTEPVIDSSVIFTFTSVSADSETKTTVRGISIDTGTTLWKADLPDFVRDTHTSFESNYLICLLKNSSLIKINKKTGEAIKTEVLPENAANIKIINEDLIIYIKDKILNAYQPASKNVIWSSNLQAETSSITPIVQDKTLFLTTKNEYIMAISLTTGKTLWKKKVAKNIQDVFFANNSLMVATTENYLHSLSLQGKQKWKKLLDGRPSGNLLIYRGSILMFTVGSNYGIVLDISKGKTLNRIRLEDSEYVVAPPVATGSYLFIQTQRGLTAYSNE